jgi:hypothetical protein
MARPPKIIDWDEVELRMQAGNSAREIATSCRICINTFYEKFKEEFQCSFQDYWDKSSQCGKANIEYEQYKKAMSGNVQMLLWLGQVKCGQKVSDTNAHTSPNDKPITELLNAMQGNDGIKSKTDSEFPGSSETL